uniref:Uncharacterized protein n=1 Tax=Dicentrarchus labrax TaxID=13489 RepID=A0A8P4KD66_DICLA
MWYRYIISPASRVYTFSWICRKPPKDPDQLLNHLSWLSSDLLPLSLRLNLLVSSFLSLPRGHRRELVRGSAGKVKALPSDSAPSGPQRSPTRGSLFHNQNRNCIDHHGFEMIALWNKDSKAEQCDPPVHYPTLLVCHPAGAVPDLHARTPTPRFLLQPL